MTELLTITRTSVCLNCGQVIYQIDGLPDRWLHDNPKRLYAGDIIDVHTCEALFSPFILKDEVLPMLHRSDTNQPTGIYWGPRDSDTTRGPQVLPEFCGPAFEAVAILDAARNLLPDCARCGQPVHALRLSRREVRMEHTFDGSPYCRATPIPDVLDSN